jgi:hypothetical protein
MGGSLSGGEYIPLISDVKEKSLGEVDDPGRRGKGRGTR